MFLTDTLTHREETTPNGAAHNRKVGLDDDQVIEYDHLVLATGARNRPLPVPGAELDGVCFLRTVDEATAVRARLASAKTAVVIGAGFIGLEFAASAAKLGLGVTVLDVADRPMARALSKTMSGVFASEHEKMGVRLMGEGGRVVGVETSNRPADHMLARKLLSQHIAVTPQQVADQQFDLKSLMPIK